VAQEDIDVLIARAQSLKNEKEDELLEKANVLGVGVGFKETKGKETEDICVAIYVKKKVAKKDLKSEDLVPATYDGLPTDVREVGRIEALAFDARIRPARPGYSIGHYKITAGTFGCLVRDTCYPCRTHILSNNHVLANSNAASIGDPILQPGAYDGGKIPGDVIARLTRFVPIRFGSADRYNLVDAALATARDQRDVIASIVNIGIPRGTVEATLGMEVVKSGRTTETTTGKVIGIDVTAAVNYGVGIGYFRNQIMTTNMSAGGDSGSLLLSRNGREGTGLLFAGSSAITLHNNIANVEMALGVELITA
jgi:hypothetical protein